jgi:hypothetical protein
MCQTIVSLLINFGQPLEIVFCQTIEPMQFAGDKNTNRISTPIDQVTVSFRKALSFPSGAHFARQEYCMPHSL